MSTDIEVEYMHIIELPTCISVVFYFIKPFYETRVLRVVFFFHEEKPNVSNKSWFTCVLNMFIVKE